MAKLHKHDQFAKKVAETFDLIFITTNVKQKKIDI